MSLVNLSEVRIIKTKKGYVAQIEVERGFILKRKVWTHLASSSGLPKRPWHYPSAQLAIEEVLKQIKWKLLANSDPLVFDESKIEHNLDEILQPAKNKKSVICPNCDSDDIRFGIASSVCRVCGLQF
jgi:hypothetical protein